MSGHNRSGRPLKSTAQAASEAVAVIELALALRLGRLSEVKRLHGAEATAFRNVLKRRRGLVADLIGSDGAASVSPALNKTQRAVQLVIEHGVPVAVASRQLGINLRNLKRALVVGRAAHEGELVRRAVFAKRTVTWDAQGGPPGDKLPPNTTPER